MHKDANQNRREFIGTAAALVTGIGLTGSAAAHLSLAGIGCTARWIDQSLTNESHDEAQQDIEDVRAHGQDERIGAEAFDQSLEFTHRLLGGL